MAGDASDGEDRSTCEAGKCRLRERGLSKLKGWFNYFRIGTVSKAYISGTPGWLHWTISMSVTDAIMAVAVVLVVPYRRLRVSYFPVCPSVFKHAGEKVW